MKRLDKSSTLDDILYDIRGPIMQEAEAMEARGERILKLNIGNPMPFGFRVAPSLRRAVARNLRRSEGYADSKGLPAVRQALYEHYRQRGFALSSIEDIYIGNGISELIHMTMRALLNSGDEVLVPTPDYPLWTAAVKLSHGAVRYYRCDERSGWYPDVDDIARQITHRTKILVVINPNNPTGSVYPRQILSDIVRLAERHHLLLCSDEIYSHVLYDDVEFQHLSPLTSDVPCLTYSGLSKNHLACGFRSGWMLISGGERMDGDFKAGFNMLSNMRLCSNVPTQWAIPPALRQHKNAASLVASGSRLYRQRQVMIDALADCPLIDCVTPKAAFYLFPKLDVKALHINSDTQFALDLLRAKKILVVRGGGFNYPDNAHFRMTFLPSVADMKAAAEKLVAFLDGYRQQ